MSDTVRDLVTRWGFEINDKPLKNLKGDIENLKGTVMQVGLAVTGAAATVFGFAKLTANAGDEAKKAAQKVGETVQSWGRLSYAAKFANVDNGALSASLRFLNKNLYEASQGGKEQAETFQALGLSTRDANGKLRNGGSIISEVADKFKKMEDGPKKTALAMKLFGKAGADMIPMLNGGSAELARMGDEAERLGIVFTDSEAALGEKFNDSLTAVEAGLVGIRNVVGLALMPEIIKLAETFKEFLIVNRQLIATKIREFLAGLINFLKITWTFAKNLWDAFNGLIRLFGGFENVARMLGYALAVFASAKILAGIGAIVLGIQGMVAWFTAANVAALALPILIGAAVVALGLIIEDIVNFFQGNDSVTGIIVQKFKDLFAYLEQGWANMSQPVRTFASLLTTAVLGPIRMVILAVRTLGAVMGTLAGGGGWSDVKEVLKGAGASLVRGTIGTGTLSDTLGFGDLENTSLSSKMGFTPSTAPVGGSAPAGMSQQNSLNAPITINVGENANPAAVGAAAKSGTLDGWDKIKREAMRDFKGGG